MPNNLYSRQIRYVSITVSLFLGFNVALGLNLSYGRGLSSSLKTHISRSSLPYSSNSDFNIVLSILLAAGSSLSPLNKWNISDLQRCLLEKLIRLLTNFPSNLSSLNVAILLKLPLPCFSFAPGVISALLIISLPSCSDLLMKQSLTHAS